MWFEGVFVQKMVGNSWFNKFNFEMKNKSKLNLDIWCCYLKSAPTFFSPCCRTILAGDRSIYPLYHFHLVSLDLTRNLLYFWFLDIFFFFFFFFFQGKPFKKSAIESSSFPLVICDSLTACPVELEIVNVATVSRRKSVTAGERES